MVTIANLTADAAGLKNLVADADGLKNLTANYAPLPYNEQMTVVKENNDKWTFSWTSTDEPFELYLQGEFIATLSDAEYSIVSAEEIALEVYVASVTQSAYTAINKPFADVQWFSPAEQSYLVERYLDPNWVRQGRQVGDTRTGYFSQNTGFLGDDLEENWRVTPRNEWQTEGTAVEHPFNVVSHPNPPEYTATITAGDLVIGSI
jgi:hypothetical protein